MNIQNDSHFSIHTPPQAESWLHLLQDPDARQVVIDAIHALFKRWHLHPINQAALLNLADMTDLDQHISTDSDPEVFIRIGHLLAIDRALLKRFPYQASKRDQWVWQAQMLLRGQSPMSLMLNEGLDGIKFIRYLLQTEGRRAKEVYL